MHKKEIKLLYGRDGLSLNVPHHTTVLEGQHIPQIEEPNDAILEALKNPIGSPPLETLLNSKRPKTVAITISDITRPVPNRVFLPPMIKLLNDCGITDSQITVIVGTGMHRESTPEEHEILVGRDLLSRVKVIDHRADAPDTLVRVCNDPPVSICKHFAQADFRIVTGYIEPHFMAGFSGGRKGVCPALVDLNTVQQFHGYRALSNPLAETGNLTDNPCHDISLRIAKAVGVDFLFNVAVTHDRKLAGIYCGDLELAHETGCKQVAEWTTAYIEAPFDLVITNGGGYPLDQTFYQTVKGMCTALPALHKHSTLLQASSCDELLGSQAYTDLLLDIDNKWECFLADIKTNCKHTKLDQWQMQMQTRVLNLIGIDKLMFICDAIEPDIQRSLCVTPILGKAPAQKRMQITIDDYVTRNPNASIAAIPQGPYTMIKISR